MARKYVKGIKKYIPIFKEAKDKDLNEADLVTRLIKFMEDVLEYDIIKNVTKEFQIKDRYVDLAIKVDDKIKLLIEVKSASVNLREGQIYQAEAYASQSGIKWVLLTNGEEWHLYHLSFDKNGIEHTLVFDLNMINEDNIESNADRIQYLSLESLKKDELDNYWEKVLSLQANSLIRALFHEDTLNVIRREIRRKSDVLLAEDEVLDGVKKLLSEDIIKQHGDLIKITRRRRSYNKEKGEEAAESNTVQPVSQTTLAKPIEQPGNNNPQQM